MGDTDNHTLSRIRHDNSDNSLQFHTIEAERMRITSTGKIAIGTTASDCAMSIQTAAVTGNLNSSGVCLFDPSTSTDQVIPITASFISSTYRARSGIAFMSKGNGSGGAFSIYTAYRADGSTLSTSDEKFNVNNMFTIFDKYYC